MEVDSTPETMPAIANKTAPETSEVLKSATLVAELEDQFKNRFTEKDEEYNTELEKKDASPPVVPNFGGSDRSRDRKRSRSRSRSRSPTSTLKRKGLFDCYSYFVFYY